MTISDFMTDGKMKIAPSYYVDSDGNLTLRSFDLVLDPDVKECERLRESKEDRC